MHARAFEGAFVLQIGPLGVAADVGVEDVREVGEERVSLQATGDRGGEEPLDRALALLGLAAE